MDLELGMAIIRVVAGLMLAAHGAQKVFGWQEGPGLERWTGAVQSMGFRPARLWALAAAYGELVGGLLFAVGLLTGIAAGPGGASDRYSFSPVLETSPENTTGLDRLDNQCISQVYLSPRTAGRAPAAG